jgi:Protein of unknown function (DUF3352)
MTDDEDRAAGGSSNQPDQPDRPDQPHAQDQPAEPERSDWTPAPPGGQYSGPPPMQYPGPGWDYGPSAEQPPQGPSQQYGSAQYPSQPYPGDPFRSGGQGGGQYPPGQYPTGQYPAGQPAPGQYPGGPYPGGQPPGQYPTGGYPSGEHPAAPYPSGPYETGPYPGGEHPGGQYPGGEYAGGQYPPPGGYPGGQYPPPGEYPQYAGGYPPGPGGYGQPDYLGPGPGLPPPRRPRRRALWAALGVITVIALSVGGVYGYQLVAGGGVALDQRVPGDAASYVEFNFDPPAGQKVAALQFFRHFPSLKVREDSKDLLDGLVEPLIEDPAVRKQFVDNIKPWLGKHVAVAIDPQGSEVEPILVLEATDTAKARSGLDALKTQESQAQFGYVIKDKVVMVARTDSVAATAAQDAATNSLHDNSTFRSDLKSVGDDGVLAAWMNLERFGDLTKLARSGPGSPVPTPPAPQNLHGRVMASLKFTSTTADFVVRGAGMAQLPTTTEKAGQRLATLPDDTAMGVAFSGADKLVESAYKQLQDAGLTEELQSLEKETGLDLPADVMALVGSSTVLAVGGSKDDMGLGLISKTDDPARARVAAARLLKAIGSPDNIAVKSTSDGTVIANSSSYADKLAVPGTLGDSEQFRTTLPELDSAQIALYVDVHRLAEVGGDSIPDSAAALRSVGLTANVGSDSFNEHFRVVVG